MGAICLLMGEELTQTFADLLEALMVNRYYHAIQPLVSFQSTEYHHRSFWELIYLIWRSSSDRLRLLVRSTVLILLYHFTRPLANPHCSHRHILNHRRYCGCPRSPMKLALKSHDLLSIRALQSRWLSLARWLARVSKPLLSGAIQAERALAAQILNLSSCDSFVSTASSFRLHLLIPHFLSRDPHFALWRFHHGRSRSTSQSLLSSGMWNLQTLKWELDSWATSKPKALTLSLRAISNSWVRLMKLAPGYQKFQICHMSMAWLASFLEIALALPFTQFWSLILQF